MRRVVYYIIHASAEENQNGRFHYSEPYADLETAKRDASKIKDDFVTLEKRHEIYRTAPAGRTWKDEKYAWELDDELEEAIKVVEFL